MRLCVLLVILAISPMSFAGDEEGVRFMLDSYGRNCANARTIYKSLSEIEIFNIGRGYDVTGYMADGERVILKLRMSSVRGTGGFGPSGWIDTYSCDVESF